MRYDEISTPDFSINSVVLQQPRPSRAASTALMNFCREYWETQTERAPRPSYCPAMLIDHHVLKGLVA